jgi:hypothetical protein
MDRQGLSTPQNLLHYLESIYIDLNEVARARDKLREEKQKGNESFTFYLPKFERLLAEAELTDAPEGVKISYLEGNISIDLRRALIGREKPQSYTAYVRTLLGLASDLEGLAYYEKRHSTLLRAPAGQFQPRSLPPAPPGPSGPTEGSMDWEPSPRASRGRLTPQEKEERYRKGLCLYCGQNGHLRAACPLAPALQTRAHAGNPAPAEPRMSGALQAPAPDSAAFQGSQNLPDPALKTTARAGRLRRPRESQKLIEISDSEDSEKE